VAQEKDVLAKLWFLTTPNSFFVREILKIREEIELIEPGEFPLVTAHRADLIFRAVSGQYFHIEFMSSNEPHYEWKMLGYRCDFAQQAIQTKANPGSDGQPRKAEAPLRQIVVYLGRAACSMTNRISLPNLEFQFDLVNVQEMDPSALLNSPNPDDQIWSLAARGNADDKIRQVLTNFSSLAQPEQSQALNRLTILSGIMKLDEVLKRILEAYPMLTIDLENNAVIRPILEKRVQQAREEAELRGSQRTLLAQMNRKFGAVPASIKARVQNGSNEELETWLERILDVTTVEEVID
jgi:hypothetical protein